MANSPISFVSMAKARPFSYQSGRDIGGADWQVLLRARVPCGRQLSVGMEAKLRPSLGERTSVSLFVTWEGRWLDQYSGCGEGGR